MKYHTHEGDYCSDECIKDTIIFPLRNNVTCNKDQLQMNYGSYITMFYDNGSLSASELFNISDSFKNVTKDSISSWIQNIEKIYPTIFKVYKIPSGLISYRYADTNRWDANFTSRSNDNYYYLCIYRRSYRNNNTIENNIINLTTYMPLLSYLERENK